MRNAHIRKVCSAFAHCDQPQNSLITRSFFGGGKKPIRKGQYLSIGLAIGLMLGLAMDNIPIGLCIGVALGAAYSANTKKEENKK